MAGFLLLLRRALFLQRLLRFLLLFLLLVQVLGHDGLRWLGGRRRANECTPPRSGRIVPGAGIPLHYAHAPDLPERRRLQRRRPVEIGRASRRESLGPYV